MLKDKFLEVCYVNFLHVFDLVLKVDQLVMVDPLVFSCKRCCLDLSSWVKSMDMGLMFCLMLKHHLRCVCFFKMKRVLKIMR